MVVVFPAQPFEGRRVDYDFEEEWCAAREAGFEVALYSLEEERLLGPAGEGEAIHRGWMMPVEGYRRFYSDLAQRGLMLMTSPEEYRYCHHLPAWYPELAAHTPVSVWFEGARYSLERIHQDIPHGPMIVKDYVKSEKHYWNEACFIPEAQSETGVEQVVGRFLELREGAFEGGLVFRRFVPFRRLGTHSVSGMPVVLEHRVFVFQGRPLLSQEYWPDASYAGCDGPPETFLQDVIAKVRSPFFSLDLACDEEGRWWVVELGDGQVAGLCSRADAAAFYGALFERAKP